MIRTALSSAWRAWTGNWLLLLAIIAVTYWPLDMLQSYIEYHWLDPDDLRRSFKLTKFIDQCFLIIPDAAIYYIGLLWLTNRKCSFGEALGAGFRNYGRMWVTRFLTYLSFLTLLLLILPGVYLLTRWSVSEVCAVAERRMGTGAFGCSWRRTEGRVWTILGALTVGILMFLAVALVPMCVSLFLPDLWWIDALASMAISLVTPLWLLYEVGIYAQLSEPKGPAAGTIW